MSNWILDLGTELRAEVSRRPWRTRLNGEDLAWTHQLAWQSVEYTQTLGLQWAHANPRDSVRRDLHADHAADEARHPRQLWEWMDEERLLVEAGFLEVPPTDETVILMGFNTRVALREPFPVRVGVLNVIGEGIALDAFTAMIDALGGRGRLNRNAKFWKIHKVADGDHLRIGVSELGPITESSPEGRDIARMMRLAARLYGDMLDSWFETEGVAMELEGYLRREAELRRVIDRRLSEALDGGVQLVDAADATAHARAAVASRVKP